MATVSVDLTVFESCVLRREKMFQELIDPSPQIATPEELFDVVSLVYAAVDKKRENERRITERERAFLPVVVRFLDEELNPIGEDVEGMSRDVSIGGAGIVCRDEPPVRRLMLSFPSLDTVPMMCEVKFTEPVGPFYHLGLSFCVDWS